MYIKYTDPLEQQKSKAIKHAAKTLQSCYMINATTTPAEFQDINEGILQLIGELEKTKEYLNKGTAKQRLKRRPKIEKEYI